MSKNPLRRLRAVMAAGLVIAGLSAALPAAANLPGQSASNPTNSGTASGSDVGSAAAISATTVIPASTLVDSVGVGVHLTKSDSSYANYPAVKSALLETRHPSHPGRHQLAGEQVPRAQPGGDQDAGHGLASRCTPKTASTRPSATSRSGAPRSPASADPTSTREGHLDWVLQAAGLPESDLLEGQRQRDAEGCPGSRPVTADGHERASAGQHQPGLGRRRRPRLPLRPRAGRNAGRLSPRGRGHGGSKPVVVTETGMANGNGDAAQAVRPGVLRAGRGHLHAPTRHGVLPAGCEAERTSTNSSTRTTSPG